jgi:tetratricopeptide (TPR) repeat protein
VRESAVHRYTKAAFYLSEALRRGAINADSAPYLATYYCNYAEALWQLGRREEAVDSTNRAEEIAKSVAAPAD